MRKFGCGCLAYFALIGEWYCDFGGEGWEVWADGGGGCDEDGLRLSGR